MRVLFIGNSYTSYEEMPQQVVRLAQSIGSAAEGGSPSVHADMVVEGGANLQIHWEETGARARVAEGGWDHVVIQDLSTGPLHDAERFVTHTDLFAGAARDVGAVPIFFETWARALGHAVYGSAWSGQSPEAMQAGIRAAYRAAAKRNEGLLAPVGDAWEIALRLRPGIRLHDDDLHHASPLGSHLAALVFFGLLTGEAPTDASYHPADVPPDVAAWLRERATEALANQQKAAV